MCGITVKIFLNRERNFNIPELRAMAGPIANRGPGDEGFYNEVDPGLGFRRKSTINLSQGHQPISKKSWKIMVAALF